MDRLSFEIGERLDYLQHTVTLYVETGTHYARNALDYASNQASSALSQISRSTRNGIPFQTWVQWHWQWFVENCAGLHHTVQRFLVFHCQRVGETLHTAVYFIQNRVLQSHLYFFFGGVAFGFVIGYHMKQNPKSLVRMRALVCNFYKGAESIGMAEDIIAPTTCRPNEVLIQVKASSLDPIDLKICLGYGKVLRAQYHNYHKTHGRQQLFPFVLGRECSGRIVEIGSKVQDLEIGDEVYAAVPYYACGAASECALLPSDWVARKPKRLSHEAAASLPYSSSVVWNALVLQASLNESKTCGKRFLVHSADNPVGCLAIQLIKAWGGHVTATVCSRAMATAQQLGVDDIILHDGNQIDFQVLLENRPKFHLVLNTVGSFLHDSCRMLCEDGGLVVSTVAAPQASDKYGLLCGSAYSMWLKMKMTLTGSVCGSMTISRQILEEISDLVNRGKIQPVIERIFDVEQAEQASEYAAKGNTIGKIIIRFKNRPLNRLDGLA